MIYESEDAKRTWGALRVWVLREVCMGDGAILQTVEEGLLEILGRVEQELEELFPGADFRANFSSFTAPTRRELTLIIKSTYEYFERLWGVEISRHGVIKSEDVPKIAGKEDLVGKIGHSDGESFAYLGSVRTKDIPGVADILTKYSEMLRPQKMIFTISGIDIVLSRRCLT